MKLPWPEGISEINKPGVDIILTDLRVVIFTINS